MNPTLLMVHFVAGTLGFGYFTFGRKQAAMLPLFCGLLLMVLPALMPNLWVLLTLCGVLLALPWVLRNR